MESHNNGEDLDIAAVVREPLTFDVLRAVSTLRDQYVQPGPPTS